MNTTQLPKKIVLMFPGQGSQFVGMDKFPRSLIDSNELIELWQKINFASGKNLQQIIQSGPIEELTLTENTQPAIVAMSFFYFSILKNCFDLQSREVIVLGHSLGEYSALLAAGSISLEQAIQMTTIRGRAMQSAVPNNLGSMIALLKVPLEKIQEATKFVQSQNPQLLVEIANINSADQIVISGHREACNRAVEWLAENHQSKHRAIPLQVSAPFHCALMKPVEEIMKQTLEHVTIHKNQFSYIPNFNAQILDKNTDINLIKKNLLNQISHSVLWSKSIETLDPISHCFIDMGPGTVLKGLLNKIHPATSCLAMDQSTNDNMNLVDYKKEILDFLN